MSVKAALQKKRQQASVPAEHLVIVARAGTGKTTTLIQGLHFMKGNKTTITPSDQQKEIWGEMAKSTIGLEQDAVDSLSIAFCAFNSSIVNALEERVPEGCTARTMHSMGVRAVRGAYGGLKVNKWRVDNLLEEITGVDSRELSRKFADQVQAVKKLVGLCKVNLMEPTEENLDLLCAEHDIDNSRSREKIYGYIPKILDLCAQPMRDREIDFNDMIWLPIVNNLSLTKYDILLVDEAQDLNKCQQELAMRSGRRLIFCGDDKQAIYGFAGADCQSLPNLISRLETTDTGAVVRPLTVTRRCGKLIVAEAQQYVPDFEAHESNGDGNVTYMRYSDDSPGGEFAEGTYQSNVKDGDMVLCRVNAPLVQQCFRFLRAGRKANIQGRDIGKGLTKTVKKLNASSITDLVEKLEAWYLNETKKESVKKNPNETKLIMLQDRFDCLNEFILGATKVQEVLDKIDKIFSDKETSGIRLSSIHRAKGLEARRVFLLQPKGATMPHPMAKSRSAREQEYNLLYVAITRAIEELVYVS